LSNPRIIAGKAKGTRLQPVPGDITRPITDRVKEALFNIIGQDIFNASFLDLFGGTGSVGIEALSRGASFVRLVDLHNAAIKTIKTNLTRTHLEQNAQVVTANAFNYLSKPADRAFDYIYIAPPQYKQLWQKAIQVLDSHPDWFSEDTWVIVQIDPIEYERLNLHNLFEFDQRQYGSTLLVFYEVVSE